MEPTSSSPSNRRMRFTGRPVGRQGRFGGGDLEDDLRLVVGGAPGDEVVALPGQRERGRAPFVEGVGGLHVVVRVHQQRGRVGARLVPAHHQGVAVGVDHGGLQARPRHASATQDAAAAHVVPVRRIGGDAGDGDEFGEVARKRWRCASMYSSGMSWASHVNGARSAEISPRRGLRAARGGNARRSPTGERTEHNGSRRVCLIESLRLWYPGGASAEPFALDVFGATTSPSQEE